MSTDCFSGNHAACAGCNCACHNSAPPVPWWHTSAFRMYVPYLHNRTKRGLELRVPDSLGPKAAALLVSCVHCGAPIHCFRQRRAPAKRGEETTGAFYLAVSCPTDVSSGCHKGKAASDALMQIENMVGFL